MKKRCLIMNLVMIILLIAFVSVANAGPLSNWSLRYTSSVQLNAVTFGKGMFVAVGNSGTIVISPDGKGWTVTNSGTTEDLAGVVFGNNKFVAVGFNLISTSLDGVTWTSKQAQLFGANPSIAYGNGLFVVASYAGKIFTSSDGLDWTLIQTTPCYLKTPSYGNGKFVIPGTRGYGTGTYVYVSSNGLNWSEYNVVAGYQANDSAFGNGLFVIVGQKYDAPHNGVILRSADGFHWTELDTEVVGFGGIAYGDLGFLVPVGEGFLVSSDAVSWSLMQGGWPFGNATTFANSTYVTVGSTIYQSDPVSSTNNCTTTVSNDLTLHVPIIFFGEVAACLDLQLVSDTVDFTVTGLEIITDLSPFDLCTPATLTQDFKLHVPSIVLGDVSYWADFQYAQGLTFTLIGAGQN